MDINTVQRIFQLRGWQARKRATGHRPRIEALPSVATSPDQRWATDRRERRGDADLDRGQRLRADRDHPKRAQLDHLDAYVATDPVRYPVRENALATGT